ncbi:NF-X1-type zinc finger protein NFXL1 [Tanacetum coccineum]
MSSVGRKSNAIFALPGHGSTSSVGLYYTRSAFIIINPSHHPLVRNEREWYLSNASVTPTIESFEDRYGGIWLESANVSATVVDMSRERIGNGNDRRQPRNYRLQEWIPRGSTPSITPPPLDTTNININTPFASNSNLDANHHHPPYNRSHNPLYGRAQAVIPFFISIVFKENSARAPTSMSFVMLRRIKGLIGDPCGRPVDKDHHVGNHDDDDRDDGRCRHRCVVQCHPGPCPPCKAFAPPRICPCGKKTITTRCLDQKSLLTCAQRCGKRSTLLFAVIWLLDIKDHAKCGKNDGIFRAISSCGISSWVWKPCLACGKDLQSPPHYHVVHRHHLVNTRVRFLNQVVTRPYTAVTLETVHHVQFQYQKNALGDMLFSETYHAIQKISGLLNNFVENEAEWDAYMFKNVHQFLCDSSSSFI